jgi:ribosomal protein S18 acetylase RimI-like enzyme
VTKGSQEITLGVPADVAWNALVAPGRRDWYYLLSAEGEFAKGKQIRWLDRNGQVAEESEVLEATPSTRLVLRTRFVFAPPFAKANPHTVKWEVTPTGSGCRVQMSWIGEGPAVGLYESEGESLVRGLRLAVDPVAQAEVARRPAIGEVEVYEVTSDRLADYQAFFDNEAFRDYPAWQSCYCMETHRTQGDEEWAARTAAENRRDMSAGIVEGKVTGLLAYADGKPVGWCNYGETTRLSGVMHKLHLSADDHEGVGSVACFVIAAPYRGHGVAARLLDSAIERLRRRGVRAVEAYPRRAEDSAQANYRGPLGMYLRAGFELYRETDKSIVVRKTL